MAGKCNEILAGGLTGSAALKFTVCKLGEVPGEVGNGAAKTAKAAGDELTAFFAGKNLGANLNNCKAPKGIFNSGYQAANCPEG